MTDFSSQKFFTTFDEFLTNLGQTFPEAAPQFAAFRKNVTPGRTFIATFSASLRPHAAAIRAADETLFSAPFQVVPGVDLAVLWHAGGISVASKKAIWQYLQILFAMSNFITNAEDAIRSGELQDLVGSVKKLAVERATEPSDDGETPSFIESLANDIAAEISLPDGVDPNSPFDVIKSIFSSEGGFGRILSKVGSQLEEKVKSGELTQAALENETRHIMKKLGGLEGIEGMPDLSGLLSSLTGKDGLLEKLFDGKTDLSKVMEGGGGLDPAAIITLLQNALGSMGAADGGGGANPLAPILSMLPGLLAGGAGGGAGSQAAMMDVLKNMMGGGSGDEMPDLEEIQENLRKEARKQYSLAQETHRADLKRAELRKKLESRKASDANRPKL